MLLHLCYNDKFQPAGKKKKKNEEIEDYGKSTLLNIAG